MKNSYIFKRSLGFSLIVLIIFIATRIVISNEYLSTFLEIGIAILSAGAISMILIPYTYKETKRIERDEYFRLLYEEIDLIRNKIPETPEQINILRDKWKSFEQNKWIYKKHPVLFPYSQSTRFFYQYLPNNAFYSLINRGFVREIKGFNPKSNDNQYHMISLFYLYCKNASELSERIEDYINICIDNKPNNNSPSNCFKLHDIVFQWIDSKTIQFTDINRIDTQGHPIGHIKKSWEEFVDEKCDEIIQLFEDLDEKIDKKIKKYKNYQEFYNDVINEKDIASHTDESIIEKKFSLFWPIYGFTLLVIMLLFPMVAFSLISTYFLILIFLFLAFFFYICYRSINQFKKEPNKKGLGRTFVSILFIWLLFQIVIIGSVEFGVINMKSQYNKEYSELLKKNNGDELNATWNIANLYLNKFSGRYGQTDAIIPSRIFTGYYIPYVTPLFQVYFFNYDGLDKLTLIQHCGNCGEFSHSIALLLNISTNHETRIVTIQGADHAFSEVNINQNWWIFDKIFLTPGYPIEAKRFSQYISQDLNLNIANLESSMNDSDILEQHGFSPIDLKVTVIDKSIANQLENKVQENAILEVFLITNSSSDPLISQKKTDKSGNCHFRLIGNKKYLISVKKDNMVGLNIVDLDLSSNQSEFVYLRKYD